MSERAEGIGSYVGRRIKEKHTAPIRDKLECLETDLRETANALAGVGNNDAALRFTHFADRVRRILADTAP